MIWLILYVVGFMIGTGLIFWNAWKDFKKSSLADPAEAVVTAAFLAVALAAVWPLSLVVYVFTPRARR